MSNPVVMVRIWSEKHSCHQHNLQEWDDILHFSCLKSQSETFKTPVKYRVNVGQESYNIGQKSCLILRGVSSRHSSCHFLGLVKKSPWIKDFPRKIMKLNIFLGDGCQYVPSFCDVESYFLLGLSFIFWIPCIVSFTLFSTNLFKFKIWVQSNVGRRTTRSSKESLSKSVSKDAQDFLFTETVYSKYNTYTLCF